MKAPKARETSGAFLARMKRVDPRSREERKLEQEGIVFANRRASDPVLTELKQAGFDVQWIADLRSMANYEAAIPILIKWLPLVSNPAVKADIVRCLSVPVARTASVPLFLAEYRRADDERVREALANGLEILADNSTFEDLVSLVEDVKMGPSRKLLTLALGRMTGRPVIEVLVRLLKDDVVLPFAIMALGKLRASEAGPYIQPFLDSRVPEIRQEAKKALARMKC